MIEDWHSCISGSFSREFESPSVKPLFYYWNSVFFELDNKDAQSAIPPSIKIIDNVADDAVCLSLSLMDDLNIPVSEDLKFIVGSDDERLKEQTEMFFANVDVLYDLFPNSKIHMMLSIYPLVLATVPKREGRGNLSDDDE
jgi:hypothetical protein